MDDYETAAKWIKQADGLLITAGAGIGVDSGLPDFRGNHGLWNQYPALAEKSMDFYETASPGTFICDPDTAWGFYGHRLELYRKTVPHEGFQILRGGQRIKFTEYSYSPVMSTAIFRKLVLIGRKSTSVMVLFIKCNAVIIALDHGLPMITFPW